MKKKLSIALLLTIGAFGFRFWLALRFPNDTPGDTVGYVQLAKNLLHHHTYSKDEAEPLQPTYYRVPGYPLLLLAVYVTFGEDNQRMVRIVQAGLDTISCWLVALLVLAWSPPAWELNRRQRAMFIALGLMACCPFTAIYTTVLLTEVLAMLLIVFCVLAATRAHLCDKPKGKFFLWLAAGLAAGAATQTRPDAGLFAAGVGVWLALSGLKATLHLWRKEKSPSSSKKAEVEPRTEQLVADGATPQPSSASLPSRESLKEAATSSARQRFAQMMYCGVIFSLGFALILAPWTIRNARVFGVFQPIAPATANMPNEFVPQGYNDWLRTWVDRESLTEKVDWPLGQKRITIKMMPDYAFDSAEEKAQVAALLERYNHPPQDAQQVTVAESVDESVGNASDDESEEESEEEEPETQPAMVKMAPEIDAGFAEIASARKARHPFRYFVITPLKRARYLWFSTHSEYFPFTGELDEEFDTDLHQQYWLPLFFGLLCFYTILAIVGLLVLWRHREMRRWLLLFALLIVPRFAYLATLQNPEPRYVVEFFPLVLVLCAVALAATGWRHRADTLSVS